MKLKNSILMVLMAVTTNVVAAIKVSDVKVFSGHPWKEVVIGYTITGTVAETGFDVVIELNALDKSANKTYTSQSLTGAVLTEGRHVLRWNAAAEGVKLSSANVVFSLSIAEKGVQLWENGPYWANCNIGATESEECGYYFWWGDMVGYKRNAKDDGWISVKDSTSFHFFEDKCPTYDKNVYKLQSEGYIDRTGNLVAKYDAATVHLGAPWRLPTAVEFDALLSNCTTTWTKLNGVAGLLVRGKGSYSPKSIFLPAAGNGDESGHYGAGQAGRYWSSSLVSDPNDYCDACYLQCFHSGKFSRGSLSRHYGLSVRPVRGFAK